MWSWSNFGITYLTPLHYTSHNALIVCFLKKFALSNAINGLWMYFIVFTSIFRNLIHKSNVFSYAFCGCPFLMFTRLLQVLSNFDTLLYNSRLPKICEIASAKLLLVSLIKMILKISSESPNALIRFQWSVKIPLLDIWSPLVHLL